MQAYKKVPKVKAKLKKSRREVVDLEPARVEAAPKRRRKKEAKAKVEARPANVRGQGSYVLQEVKCGDPTCRCAKGGKLHGPYWYLFTKKDGKERSKYIGKNLPTSSGEPVEPDVPLIIPEIEDPSEWDRLKQAANG